MGLSPLPRTILPLGGGPTRRDTRVLDHFLGPDATPLPLHALDYDAVGLGWQATLTLTGSPLANDIRANKASCAGQASPALGVSFIETLASDVKITCQLTTPNVAFSGSGGIAARRAGSGASSTYFRGDVVNNTNTIRILRIDPGPSQTIVASGSLSFTVLPGTTYSVEFDLIGTALTWIVNGESLGFTTSTNQTATQHGLVIQNLSPSTAIDDFQVVLP